MHVGWSLLPVDVMEDIAALLLHPLVRGNDLGLVPREPVVYLLIGVIVAASQEKAPLRLCVGYANQDEVDTLALVELHSRVEHYRFSGLSRRTVDEEMFLPCYILDEVVRPEVDGEEFRLEESGILNLFYQMRSERRTVHEASKTIAGI